MRVSLARFIGRVVKHARVVNDPRIAGSEFDGGDRLIARQTRRDDEHLIIVADAGGNGVSLGHFNDEIGLAELPAFDKSRRFGHATRVAFARSGFRPAPQDRAVSARQPR